MNIPLIEMLVSKSYYPLKCPNEMTAKYFTVHNTANDASARAEVKYMINNGNATSYHYAIDDKEVVQGIPTNRNAWHCGDGSKGTGNRQSIGFEICYSKSGGERYKKAEALAIKFIAQELHKRRWGIERVQPHYRWSGKNCPHRIRDEGRWTSFLGAIQKELNALDIPVTTAEEVDKRVVEERTDWLMEPIKFNTSEFANATSRVLARFEKKDPALAAMWREKFLKGELTGAELLGLIMVAIDRSYITGSGE